jgi:hypothetical protein
MAWCASFQFSLSFTHYSTVPSAEEIEFVLEIMEKIASPALDRIEQLLDSAGRWDSVGRNDFCRYVLEVPRQRQAY